MVPSTRAFIITAVALAGCASRTASRTSTFAPPGCLRAEATSHAGGAQELTFDADGNLTQIVELDDAGNEVARTTLDWSSDSIVVSRSGALANVQRGVLGAHGELVEWTTDAERVRLHWDGTFAPVVMPPRFAFETYYHVIGDEPLLPLDTTSRGVWPRMRAFTFTGTVVLHRDGTPDARATYDRGRQIERSTGRGVMTRTTWRGDVPVEQASSDGTRRTFSSARGHLTGITGDPGVTFTYDAAANLTRVRTDHGKGLVIEVAVSRCASR